MLVLLLLGAFSQCVPNIDQFLSTLLRMVDSLRPQILVLCLATSIGLIWFGMPRIALAAAVSALVGLAGLTLDYRAHSVPWGQDSDLTVLWANLYYENTIPPDRIAAKLRSSGADVIVLTEALPAIDAPAALDDLYPYHAGCIRPERCTLLVLSRWPLQVSQFKDLPHGPERMARIELDIPGKGPLALRAAHMIKPWYVGLTGAGAETLDGLLAGPLDAGRPLLLTGDFNAAPWSYRTRDLERRNGLRHAPRPVSTWPVWAGPFGVPLDQMMVAGDVQITSLVPWGEDIGSNHRGLLAEIDMPN